MMSVQTLSTSSGAAGYYSQADNYYFVGELLTEWHGKLAGEMGLSGSVDLKTFDGLLSGNTPDGRKMGKKHRPGLDMTFSAPKSVSILALVGGDQRLIQAFQESVRETISEIEAFISTRVTKDKQTEVANTGKGIFASFVHDTSRNLDPQLHMHVIAMNITEKDGKLYSLSSDKRYGSGFMEMVYTHHTLFGTIQRNILEKKVTELGYTTRPTEKGLWEITGVPTNLLGHFSSRSRDIRRAVGDGASFGSRNIAALDTRSPKQVPDRNVLLQEWNSAIRDHGFDMGEFIVTAKEQAEVSTEPGYGATTPVRIDVDRGRTDRAKEDESPERNAPGKGNVSPDSAEPGKDEAPPENAGQDKTALPTEDAEKGEGEAGPENSQPGTGLIPLETSEPGTGLAVTQTPESVAVVRQEEPGKPLQTGRTDRTEKHTQPRSREDDDRVINTALSALSNRKRDFSYNEVVLEMAACTENVMSLRDGERLIDRAIESGRLIPLNNEKNRFTSESLLIDEKVIVELARDHVTNGLVSGTRRPVENALPALAENAVTIISAPSTVRGVKDVIGKVISDQEDRGRSVTVLSPTANRRDQIALDADEKMIFRDLSNPDTVFTRNSTVIVDNAERLSARDSVNLLSHARENNLQLILVNTSARSSQTNVLTLFEEGGASVAKVSTEHEDFSVQVRHAPDKTQRGKELASEYAAAFDEKARPVVVATTPLDKRQITDEIRIALKEKGGIDSVAQGVMVEARNEVFMTIAQKKQYSNWRVGYVIEDRTERKPEVFTVAGIIEDTKSLILFNDKGEKSTVRASGMGRKDVRVFESTMIEVVPGELLKASAALKNQGIRAKDALRVHEAGEREITGINERTGKAFTLYTHEPVYASYGYVSGMGEVNRAEGTVIAALSKRDLNANNINTLNMSGNRLSIYSPLDEQATVSKIQNMNLRNTVTEFVIGTAQQPDIESATKYLKENLATPVAIALNRAIAGVQDVSVKAAALMENALRLDKNVSAGAIRKELNSRIASGDLISLSGDATENPVLVPRATYEVEKDILGMVTAGYATRQPLVMHVDAEKLEHLTAGQNEAVIDILTGTDTFQLVQGYAGVGKTTKLATLQAVLNETLPGLEIRGIGPTHRAVGEMSGAGINAQTAKSFILDSLRDEGAGIRHDHSNTLFIIDEASMVGNSDTRDTLGVIQRAGGRAVIIGDRKQFLPIESGAPFQLLQERTPARMSVMKDIVRQTNTELREAVYSTINGDHAGSLKQLRGIKNDIVPRREEYRELDQFQGPSLQGGASAQTVALDYLSRTDEARAETMVITGTNKVRREINELIQSGLVEDGSLSEARHVIVPVYSQVLLPRTEFHNPETWFSGAVVINDGDYFRVEKAGKEGVTVRSMDSGLRQEWDYRGLDSMRLEIFREEPTRFLEGDRVLLRKTDVDTGKTSNEAYRIQGIAENGQITLEGKAGLRQLNPDRFAQDRHIDLGYAVTSTGAQGASTRYDIGYMGTEGPERRLSNARAYYILISRAKEHAQIYTDNADRLETILQTSWEPKQTAHDVLHARKAADYAENVTKYGASLDTFYAGRVLAESFGLDTARTELQLLSRTATAPLRVVLPAYDENGKLSGVNTWALAAARGEFSLGEQRTDAETNTLFSIVQRGTTPEVLAADTLSDALTLAGKNPQASVILAPEGYENHSVILDVLDVDRITSTMVDEVMRYAEQTPATTVNADDLPEIKLITANVTYDHEAEPDKNSDIEIDDEWQDYGDSLPPEETAGPDYGIETDADWQAYSDMMAPDSPYELPETEMPEQGNPSVPELPDVNAPELELPDQDQPVQDNARPLPELPELAEGELPALALPEPEMPDSPELPDTDVPDYPVTEQPEIILPELTPEPDNGVPAFSAELPDMVLPDIAVPEPETALTPTVPDIPLPELPEVVIPELAGMDTPVHEIRDIDVADLTLSTERGTELHADELSLPEHAEPELDFSLEEYTGNSLDDIRTLGPDEREDHDPTLRHDLGEFEFNKTIDKEI